MVSIQDLAKFRGRIPAAKMCIDINPDYVKEHVVAARKGDEVGWVAVHNGRCVGFCTVAFDNIPHEHRPHACIEIICATRVPGVPVGSRLMENVLHALYYDYGIRHLYLEAAGNATKRLATEREVKLQCWYEMFDFRDTFKRTQGTRHPILYKKLTPSTIGKYRKPCKRMSKKCQFMCSRSTVVAKTPDQSGKCGARTVAGRKCQKRTAAGKCYLHR
jgi:hypothetical protein